MYIFPWRITFLTFLSFCRVDRWKSISSVQGARTLFQFTTTCLLPTCYDALRIERVLRKFHNVFLSNKNWIFVKWYIALKIVYFLELPSIRDFNYSF